MSQFVCFQFQKLPVEILCHITSFLDAKSRLSLAWVSLLWATIVNRHAIWKLVSCSSMTIFDEDFFIKMKNHRLTVKRFVTKGGIHIILPYHLEKMIGKFANLQILHLTRCRQIRQLKFLSKLPNLVTLLVEFLYQVPCYEFTRWIPKLTNLETLSLRSNYLLEKDEVLVIVK